MLFLFHALLTDQLWSQQGQSIHRGGGSIHCLQHGKAGVWAVGRSQSSDKRKLEVQVSSYHQFTHVVGVPPSSFTQLTSACAALSLLQLVHVDCSQYVVCVVGLTGISRAARHRS